MTLTAFPVLTDTGKYVAVTTLASLPSASAYPQGTSAFATDVGINGSEMVVSASSTWVPHNGSTLLTRLTLSLVKAPTFTGTTNGAITLGTAVGTLYPKCYMYFPANSLVASHSAGWYYTEMSSTTAATVYNNTYTPGIGVFPTEPTSKTAFAGAVPGGAGSTAEITAFTFNLNGGLLGNWGAMLSRCETEYNNSATNKSVRLKNGATTLSTISVSTTASNKGIAFFSNRGIQSSNRSTAGFAYSTGGTSDTSTSIDTSADVTFDVTVQTSSAATDWIALVVFAPTVEVA